MSCQCPVNVALFERLLREHPCQSLVSFIISGLSSGFDIGFHGPCTATRPRNLLSARSNSQSVWEAIAKELARGHTSGPFLSPPITPLHCSPLGAVPKKDGSYRIILDLSSPRGNAINEGICKEEFSVRYSTFDDALKLVSGLGPTAFLAKIDIKHAFRLCPVKPAQWGLLGYCWEGYYFVDTRLPFGSRSSPFLFNCFADLLCWIFLTVLAIPFVIHYLDDFFLCGRSAAEVNSYLESIQSMCTKLGVPIAEEKTTGPSQTLTYLGIEIDSQQQIIRLPADKYRELHEALLVWSGRKKCTKRELLSLIGSLSFAAKVVKPGRMFLRRLIDLSTTVASLNHHITLNGEARLDIQWWVDFLPSWNGVCFIQGDPITAASLSLFTDASGVGFGAVFRNSWFCAPWPPTFHPFHINILELFAIVAAVRTWGREWRNLQIIIYTDNASIVHVWRSGTSRDKHIMSLIRHLFLFTARLNINILLQHIPGHTNIAADLLSRLQVRRFKQRLQSADESPTPVEPTIWTILV